MNRMIVFLVGLVFCFSLSSSYSVASDDGLEDQKDLQVSRSASKSYWSLFSGLNRHAFGMPNDQIKQDPPIFLLTGDLITYLSEFMSTQELARLAQTCRLFHKRVSRLPFAPAKFTPMLEVIVDDKIANSHLEFESFISSYGLRAVVGLKNFVNSCSVSNEHWASKFRGAINLKYTLITGYVDCLRNNDPTGAQMTFGFPSGLNNFGSRINGGVSHLPLLILDPKIGLLDRLDRLSMSFSFAKLQMLPDSLGRLTNLQELDLGYNELASLPNTIGQLINLQILNLEHNKLSFVPGCVSQLTNLRELMLGGNQIHTIPVWTSQLNDLHTLDLSGNPLRSIAGINGGMKNLRVLRLGQYMNRYWAGSNTIVRYAWQLLMGDNVLTSCLNQTRLLRALRQSVLATEEMSDGLESIGYLTNLEELSFVNTNWLRAIPTTIFQISNLRKLTIVGTQLTPLPESISRLVCLEELAIGLNQITSLPEELGSLVNLRKFALLYTQVDRLPDNFKLLTRLEYLELEENRFNFVPNCIRYLTNLSHLSVSGGQIAHLPESLLDLIRLRSLNLKNNLLNSLPANIGEFSSLVELNLENNMLILLPDSFSQLTNLLTLCLNDNLLTHIPDGVLRLRERACLEISGNPIWGKK